MKFRTLGGTGLKVSEIGFDLSRVVLDLGRRLSEDEAERLLHRAFDLGVCLMESADVHGSGRGEELLCRALRRQREELTISILVGYDFHSSWRVPRPTGEPPPRCFTSQYIRLATEQALKRLRTDRIDVLQLHHPDLDAVRDDSLWETLQGLRQEGKILSAGVALEDSPEALAVGLECLRRREPSILQHEGNLTKYVVGGQLHQAGWFRPKPGAEEAAEPPAFHHGRMAGEPERGTRFLARNPVPREWRMQGVRQVAAQQEAGKERPAPSLSEWDFLAGATTGRSPAQTALLWLLAEKTMAACVMDFSTREELEHCVEAVDKNLLTEAELARVEELQPRPLEVES